jgi:hypothetical protein
MRWFAVHNDLATNRKWMALPMNLRGAWVTLLTIAAGSTPRGRIRDRATAEALIAREISTQGDDADPDFYVGELIDRGWIDEADDRTLTFHDFDEWQLAIRKDSDRPERIKQRVDRHRRQKLENLPDPPKGEVNERKGEVTPSNASNALQPPDEPLNPCPRCGSSVRLIESKSGPFYGCTEFKSSGCRWKSDEPPKARGPLIDLNSPENIALREVAV